MLNRLQEGNVMALKWNRLKPKRKYFNLLLVDTVK